ncbi:MAG: DUF5615 family PIN-like protein [Saprospiraceae bacterium]
MKFLLDENISYRIISKITLQIPNCLHVERSGLILPTSDLLIWEFAKKNNYVIITFDEDFEDLSNLNGFPPKVILLRFGNSQTQYLANTLLNKLNDIESWFKANDTGVLEIY